jgi:STE24 endopeptidase
VPGVLVAMPWLVRYGLGLVSMPPGPDRDRLEAASRRLNFRCTDLLVWNTGGGSTNAMVVGLVPALRYVVFTDRLLSDLSPDEVEAVFGHEVGHVKHGHILYYAGFLALSLTALLGAVTALLEWAYQQPQWRATVEYAAGWLTVLPVAVLGGYVFLVFGYLSRRCERQADIYGCRAVSCGQADCNGHGPGERFEDGAGTLCPTGIRTFVRALDKVADLNGISRRRPGLLQAWQHSTIDRRIRFLERVCYDPELESSFQLRVRLLRWGLFLGLAAAILGMGAAWGWDVIWRGL